MLYIAFGNATNQYPELEIHSHLSSSFISIFPTVCFHRSQAAELNTEAAVHENLLSLHGTFRFNLFIYSGQSKRSTIKYVIFHLSNARQRPVFLQEGLENTYSLLTIAVLTAGNFDPCQITDNKHYFLLLLLPSWYKNSLSLALSFFSHVSGHHNRCVNLSCFSGSSCLQLDAKVFGGYKFYSLDQN